MLGGISSTPLGLVETHVPRRPSLPSMSTVWKDRFPRRQLPPRTRPDVEIGAAIIGLGLSSESAPPHLGTDALAHEGCDLAGAGVSSQRRFREDQFVVEGHFEPPSGRGEELDVLDDRCPAGEQLVRQTDGAWHVVSGNAELNGQAMAGVGHHDDEATSLPDFWRCFPLSDSGSLGCSHVPKHQDPPLT